MSDEHSRSRILRNEQQKSFLWAGCHGMLPLESARREIFLANFEQGILNTCGLATWQAHFLPTTPAWYGAWIGSPLDQLRCQLILQALQPINEAATQSLQQTLAAAIAQNLTLHAIYYPAGRRTSTQWIIPPRCERCQVPWEGSPHKPCRICRCTHQPLPESIRRARGTRPYQPLAGLLGEKEATEYLQRVSAQNPSQRG